MLITTGDLLVADADGVVVIFRADVERVIAAGAQREKDELEIVARMQRAERTLDIYQLPSAR